jgi:predicted dehydrogenase
MNKHKINMGMVGGGPDSFIGVVHFNGAILDGQIDLVCGAFISDPGKSKITGAEYYLKPDRAYGSYQEMIEREKQLPDGERMDFLYIATPNHAHYDPARLALENGFHVVSDKSLTYSTEEALDFPTVFDGLRGMQFIDVLIESNQIDKKWTPFKN